MRHFLTAMDLLRQHLRQARALFIWIIIVAVIVVGVVMAILDKLDR